MALDRFHLLGEDIFYPMVASRKMHCTPSLRGYAHGTRPKIPIKDDESWFYRRLPSIQLENTPGGYQPTLMTTFMVYENLRFDSSGRVTHIHPLMMYQLCKFFVAARNGTKVDHKAIKESALYTGPKKMTRTPSVIPIFERVCRIPIAAVSECKGRGCSTPDASIHPLSEYIVGTSVCTVRSLAALDKGISPIALHPDPRTITQVCMGQHFNGNIHSWFSIAQIRTWFKEGLITAVIDPWVEKPIRTILVGIIYGRAIGRSHMTLADYSRLGQLAIECPVDRLIDEWPLDRKTVGVLSHIFGALSWKQLHTMWVHHKRLVATSGLGNTLLSPVFRYNGWLPLPSGTWAPIKEMCGHPLDAIDAPTNDPDPYPFRSFIVTSVGSSRTRYILMKGSTYTVWRTLLLGAKVEIHAAALDYVPAIHTKAYDADKPAPTRKPSGDFAVYNAHRLTWGSMARYLSMRREDATMHLYGSLRASIAGEKMGAHEGVFADVLMTFGYLSTVEDPSIGYNVIIHKPGPELKGLSFKDEPIDDQEVKLLTEFEVCPDLSAFDAHPAWTERIRLPALMKVLSMIPLRDQKMDDSLLAPILPEMRKSKASDASEPASKKSKTQSDS